MMGCDCSCRANRAANRAHDRRGHHHLGAVLVTDAAATRQGGAPHIRGAALVPTLVALEKAVVRWTALRVRGRLIGLLTNAGSKQIKIDFGLSATLLLGLNDANAGYTGGRSLATLLLSMAGRWLN